MKFITTLLIFVIMGQSNASGRALFPAVTPAANNITVFGNDWQYWPLSPLRPVDDPA